MLTRPVPEAYASKEDYQVSPRLGKRVIPCTMGKYKEINVMTPKTRHLCSTDYETHVNVPVQINGTNTIAMIDSGATGNFVSQTLVQSAGLPTRKKKEPYSLQMADGSELSTGSVGEETTSLHLAIQRHREEISLDVVRMATHYIILGMPWLKKYNPVINWKTGVLRFERTGIVTSIHPTRRQRTTVDEKLNRRPVEACVTSSSNKDDLKKKGSDLAGTSRGQQGQKKARVLRGSNKPPDIPSEYRKYAALFKEELMIKALPRH